MRWRMLPAMIACVFALLVVSAPEPASAISMGSAGHAAKISDPDGGLVQQVTRRWRDRYDYPYYYYDYPRPYPRYYDDRYVVYYPPYYYGPPYRYYRPPYPYYRTYYYERRVYRRPRGRLYWRD